MDFKDCDVKKEYRAQVLKTIATLGSASNLAKAAVKAAKNNNDRINVISFINNTFKVGLLNSSDLSVISLADCLIYKNAIATLADALRACLFILMAEVNTFVKSKQEESINKLSPQ